MRMKMKKEGGQALTEFVMVLPLILMVTLAIIQFAMVIDKSQKTEMVGWYAARVPSVAVWRGASIKGYVKKSEVKEDVKKDFFFDDEDEVSVSMDSDYAAILSTLSALTSVSGMTACDVKATVSCKTPYRYSRGGFPLLKRAMGGMVKDGKIEVGSETKNVSLLWSFLEN